MLGDGLTFAREELNKLKSSFNRFRILSVKNEQATVVMNDLFLLFGSYVDSWKMKEEYNTTKELILTLNKIL